MSIRHAEQKGTTTIDVTNKKGMKIRPKREREAGDDLIRHVGRLLSFSILVEVKRTSLDRS